MDTNTTSACPDPGELLRLLREESADETVADHVSTCEVCQSNLDHLSDSAELQEYRQIVSANRDATHHFDPPFVPDELGRLDDLAVVRQIGSGGMGDVFLARDLKLGRNVAVKVLSHRHSYQSDARFMREAKSAAKLRHDMSSRFSQSVARQPKHRTSSCR